MLTDSWPISCSGNRGPLRAISQTDLATVGYVMVFHVDGVKAAYYEDPTNQRADITAMIIALAWALEKYEELDTSPRLDVTIYSDSKYAIGCMNDWIYK